MGGAQNGDSEPEATPRRVPDWSKSDFTREDVVRDAFRWLDQSSAMRFRELMRTLSAFDARIKNTQMEGADNQAIILTELSEIRGKQDVWITRIERLLDERGMPHERIEDLHDKLAAIENETKERNRTIESIRVRAHAIPNVEQTGRFLAEKALELGAEIADGRDEARASSLEHELEKARAHATLIVAAETKRSARERRFDFAIRILIPIATAIIAASAAWFGLHH